MARGRFPYRTALVTGASSGIGEAVARRLAAERVDLVLVARRRERLQKLAAELAEQHGVDVEVLDRDLTEAADVLDVERRLADPGRVVDLLVSNAGFGTAGAFTGLPPDREVAQVAVNVVTPVRLARAALPGMVSRGGGGVLFVSSMVAMMPMPGSATYGATAAFRSSFAESLHVEMKGHGVHVTTLLAGLTRTEFHQVAGMATDDLPAVAWSTPDQVAGVGLAAVAAGRVTAVPGVSNRMMAASLRFVPRAVQRSMVRRMFMR